MIASAWPQVAIVFSTARKVPTTGCIPQTDPPVAQSVESKASGSSGVTEVKNTHNQNNSKSENLKDKKSKNEKIGH